MATKYSSVNLCIDGNGTEELTIKFPDLDETINGDTSWMKVKNLIVTDIPVYRSDRFEDDVVRYIFNKIEIKEAQDENNSIAYRIFGEGTLL